MAALKKVVLVGATGTVGSHILEALLATEGEFEITCPQRPTTRSTIKPHHSIKVIETTFDPSELQQIFHGQDAVIHAAGIASLSGQFAMIDAAVAANVGRFIINEFANSPDQRGLPELERFRTTKKEVREYVQRQSTQHPSFSWTGLATGNFIDYSLKKFPQFGVDIPKRKVRFVDDGNERISAVTMGDIGVAVRGILRQPDATKNRFCHIRSVETCQAEILEALREHVDGWEISSENGLEMYERGKAAFARGERTGHVDLLVVQLFMKGAGRSIVVSREESDDELLGVVEKDIGTIVGDVLGSLDSVYPSCIVKG